VTDRASRPTISDVAERAGVSTATVSRVLARIGRSRPETTDAVHRAADALGYRPSAVARSLRTQRTRTLGLLVSDIKNPFFPEIVRAADSAARAIDYSMLLGGSAFDDQRAVHYLDVMVDQRVDGLIIASSQISGSTWKWLVASPVPAILINAEPADRRVPVIASDNEGGSRLVVEHLVALGHTRIGYIGGPSSYLAAALRLRGFRAACTAAGLSPDDTPILRSDGELESGELAARQLLEQAPWVTAVACFNDLTAIGVLRAIRTAGHRVPDDISVVGFDDIAAASWVVPTLTTIAQQKGEMGRLAVEHLVRVLDGGDPEPAAGISHLPTFLRPRESTGAVRAGASGPA
jgi:LacI family transcriptional regulator